MLNFTQILHKGFRRKGQTQGSDQLRFGSTAKAFPPVVVWNITNRCNLSCIHCYGSSGTAKAEGELSLAECQRVVDQLAAKGITYLIFSGGDPMMAPHFFELAAYAKAKRIPISLSSNGTLIKDAATAERIKEVGIGYVGISLDGLHEHNDQVRGQAGAYDRALAGARLARDAGLKVGLRMTLMQPTLSQVPGILDLVKTEGFDRVYFSHLVYSGRGEEINQQALSHDQTRQAVTELIAFAEKNTQIEVVSGSNDADGVFLYLSLKAADDPRAEKVYEKLLQRGGNSSGEKIFNINPKGDVFPDQFWRGEAQGNLRQNSFKELTDPARQPLLRDLAERSSLLEGRCSGCLYLEICRGNTRPRAHAATGELWASDPACYLNDQEIGA